MYEQLFDQGVDRRGTDCVKWDVYYASGAPENGVCVGVADMDFAAPRQVTDAIVQRALHGAYGYTVECPEDRQAVPRFPLQGIQAHDARKSVLFPKALQNRLGVISGSVKQDPFAARPGEVFIEIG